MVSLVATKSASGASLVRWLRHVKLVRPMTILSKESAEEHKKLNYTTRMKETGRPVSPHVTIYSFPIGALSSITNRMTGCALAVGCAGLGLAELAGGGGSALHLMKWVGSQGMLMGAAAKFGVAFPLTYHYLGAVRHFSWDHMPDELLATNAQVESSSYFLFGASLVVSGSLMFV